MPNRARRVSASAVSVFAEVSARAVVPLPRSVLAVRLIAKMLAAAVNAPARPRRRPMVRRFVATPPAGAPIRRSEFSWKADVLVTSSEPA
jgi:hypothetical protein